MDWKTALNSPSSRLASFGLCLGIYVDGTETLANMTSAWPFVQFFLPYLFLWGSIFFGMASIASAFRFCQSSIYSPFPGVRWGAKQATIIHKNALECERLFLKNMTKVGIYVELMRLSEHLSTYRIPCPPVHNHPNCLGEWGLFLAKLSGYAETHNLTAARQLWPDTQRQKQHSKRA